MIEKILEDLREEERKFKEEQDKRKEREVQDWRKKIKEKEKREKDRKERLEKQRLISERWAMNKWITNYIKENQEQWNKEIEHRECEARNELEEWLKLKRFEKIKVLREKWNNTTTEQEKNYTIRRQTTTINENWNVWRKKRTKLPDTEKVPDEKLDPEITPIKYETSKIIQKAKISIATKSPVEALDKQQSPDVIHEQQSTKMMALKPPPSITKRKREYTKKKTTKDNKTRKITSMFNPVRKTTSETESSKVKELPEITTNHPRAELELKVLSDPVLSNSDTKVKVSKARFGANINTLSNQQLSGESKGPNESKVWPN